MKKKSIAVAIVLNPNTKQVLIAKRALHAEQGGLWEFPGGKVEANESAQQAMLRELNEEVGIGANTAQHFLALTHQYDENELHFDFFLVRQYQGKASGKEGQQIKWVSIEELANYPFPKANLPVLNALKERIS